MPDEYQGLRRMIPAIGSIDDAAAASGEVDATAIALLKKLVNQLEAGIPLSGTINADLVNVEEVTLGAGSAAIGKLAANNGVDIGDVDVASIAAGTNTIGGTRDAGPSWTSVMGVSNARVTSADASGGAVSVSDAPTAGQKIVVTDVLMSVDATMRVDVRCETTNVVIASFYIPANGTVQWTPRSKTKLATADKKLQIITSVAGNISVTAHYYSEA